MERDDSSIGEHRERPAGPSQPDDGFAEGVGEKPDSPEEELTPNFARGNAEEQDRDDQAEGRYSRGSEEAETEENAHEGRFSEGIEQLPHDQ